MKIIPVYTSDTNQLESTAMGIFSFYGNAVNSAGFYRVGFATDGSPAIQYISKNEVLKPPVWNRPEAAVGCPKK